MPKLLGIIHYRVDKNISNEPPDTTYWGYCDGKNLYVRYKYNFYQLERKDGNFYIAPTLDGRKQDMKNAGWNLLIGVAALSAGIATKDGVRFEGFNAIPAHEIPLVILPMDGT